MLIHCAVVCSQVCQCTVNSSTLRAPRTDEWGRRSSAPISCSLGYVTGVLSYTLQLLKHGHQQFSSRLHPRLSSDNRYFLLTGLVCVCFWVCLDLFQSLKVFSEGVLSQMCSCPGFVFTPQLMPCDGRLTTAAHKQSSWTCPSHLPMFTCTYRRSGRPSPLANDL